MEAGTWRETLPRLRGWFRPRLSEVLVVLNMLLVLAVLRVFGHVELLLRKSLLSSLPFFRGIALFVLLGIFVRILWVAVADGPRRARRYARSWCRPVRLAETVRILLFWGAVSWSYSWLKTFIPITNPVTYDLLLDRVDTALHFGVNPNRFVLAFFHFPAWWRFVDFSYGLFVPVAIASLGWFVSTLSTPERNRFSARFGLLWILSSWIYLAVPARGPCFVFEDDYMAARPSMPNQLRTQGVLGNQYRLLKTGGARPGPDFTPGWGTAAMPSLHVGGLVFLALWARRSSRLLSLAFAIAAAVTFVGSLITGWHYAVDGYVGALLGAACALARWPPRGLTRGRDSESGSARGR